MLLTFTLVSLISLYCVEAREAAEYRRLESLIHGLQQKYDNLQAQYQTDINERNALINRLDKRLLALEKIVHDCNSKNHLVPSSESLVNMIVSGWNGTATSESIEVDKSQNLEGTETKSERSTWAKEESKRSMNSHKIQRRQVPDLGAAFYAYMSASETSPGQHQTIIFDSVQTNIGNHYGKHTGVFTAPTSGVYFFTWSIATHCRAYVATELVVNSKAHGFIEADEREGCTYEFVTGNSVLELNTGDVVYVRTNPVYTIQGPIISEGQIRSSFAGFLILEI